MQTLKQLSNIIGNATSMITLIIPGNTNLWLSIKKMENEYGSASNIKDRENRQSVQQALRSTIYQLKQLKQLPPNGIALFSGKELYVWHR